MTASRTLVDAPAPAVVPHPRVVALIDTTQVSGPGRQLAALGPTLAADGAALHVLLFRREGRAQSAFVPYLEQIGVPYTVLSESGPLDATLVARVGAALRELRPDVVETHSYRATAIVYALRRRGERWPWVGFFHGATTENLKVRLYHWLDRRLLAAADRVVVMSKQHAHEFESLGDRAQVVYNAVVPLAASKARTPVVIPPSSTPGARAPLVGVVGRLSSEKGVDLFLEACQRLAAKGVPFEAVIAGDGPDRAALEAQRAALGLAGRVHFVGAVDDVASLYAQLALLVIPSRSEGLPNVLLEALDANVPVVSTRVGAVPEVIGDSAAGTVVPRCDVPALADAIETALANRGDPAASRARQETAERFSLRRRTAEMLRVYREVIAARAPRASGSAA